jgi:DNA-binding IclR family transcriptional regulator
LDRDAILANASWQRYTDNTITTSQAMLDRLDEVRQRGWATDEGEYETCSNCGAAPVWGIHR